MLPIITIARQFGSGGHEVGEKVAKKLGIPFYDKELITIAAKKSGYSEEVFERVDEKAASSMLYAMVMDSFSYGGRVGGYSEMPINDKLFIMQSDIIKKAVKEGPCVIIGRCADFILREHPHSLNIFLHAPKEIRVGRILDKKLSPSEKVTDFVTKTDKKRANYYNFYTNSKWDDLLNYDITLNTACFGVDMSADIIVDAAKRLRSV